MDSSTLDFNSKLSITTLLYLSSNVEGGALRVGLLNPKRDGIDGTLDIEPKSGRMVLFLSKYIPHSVEWTYSPRYTMTSFLRHKIESVRVRKFGKIRCKKGSFIYFVCYTY